ncbi:uncharacterized protein BCR38DRAFT_160714 [Pseudomassariella vexata]|uniref:Uncharacterized protein n=1 Tax=Pseudomassariella vexata TaxID=1141098 RepID=A0A1Y2E7T9_9PEZI|nr:uncharacterized protein BCR38DRAFT_160714 [Pseudomassariella vexata]ORY67602.1 hypothetical protein BCR38DRAFT_160714 [Pseudomassariella vexata]
MSNLYPPRSTPPSFVENAAAMTENGPAMLPPLQQTQSGYANQPPSLPPLSPYVHPQQLPSQQAQQQQAYQANQYQLPQSYQQLHRKAQQQDAYQAQHLQQPPQQSPQQHEGFHALYQASQHQTPMIQSYHPQTYMQDCNPMPIGDDGYDFHLEQMISTHWNTPNGPSALYDYSMGGGQPPL